MCVSEGGVYIISFVRGGGQPLTHLTLLCLSADSSVCVSEGGVYIISFVREGGQPLTYLCCV